MSGEPFLALDRFELITNIGHKSYDLLLYSAKFISLWTSDTYTVINRKYTS
jgi:hypothetical protein